MKKVIDVVFMVLFILLTASMMVNAQGYGTNYASSTLRR
jgi:hypothetical protein